MLIGYVSDESYRAIPDVLLEFRAADGGSWETRSRASGSIILDLPPGTFEVVLQKEGYGSKRVRLKLPTPEPYSFRLLSDGLVGFAWPKAIRCGERGEFRIHATEPYQVSLWRYGWTKEKVAELGWHDEHGPRAMMQITPDGDYSQSGVRWNQVGYSGGNSQHEVMAPKRTGLHYFHAETASGDRFAFPWVVAPHQPGSRVAVLASDLTWNAYNSFGGRGNYLNAQGLPAEPIVNSRQDLSRFADAGRGTWGYAHYPPLSFERPEPINTIALEEQITDPIEGRSACHVAPAEWRLFGWLERQGFLPDLYSETQFHRGCVDLSAYKVLILGAHPEYWTRAMYFRLKRWVFEEGGRLMYLGGNGLNCEVEWEADHTMRVFNGQIRGLWPEGIGAESRFAARVESEASLLGVVFNPAGAMTAAPYRVIESDHWVFEGTGLQKGDLFGLKSLHKRCPGGASGHETDKISPHSPKHLVHLAKGENSDEGGADMILYATPSGGMVFSAGSISYPACLPVDDLLSRITDNVLRRFLE